MATQVTNDWSPPQAVPIKPAVSIDGLPQKAADQAPKAVELKGTPEPESEPESSVSEIVSRVSQIIRRELNFALDKDSGRTVVKIIDAESQELVRQIPPEELLILARRLQEMTREQSASGEQLKGLLVTTKV